MTSYLRQKIQSLHIGSSLWESEDVKKEVLCENNEENEWNKVKIMRALVEAQDPSVKDVDDLTIRRFLRARDLDVERASAMFIKHLNWKKEFVPNGSISESEISNDIAHNKLFMQGCDKTGRPIVVLLVARHKPTTVEDLNRFVAYSLDKVCARMPNGHEKFIAIADLEGWGYANSDIRGYISALLILQDCYPERLAKLLFIHVPYIFMTAWKLVYPFVDKNTKKKIIFVENKNLQSTLGEDIDESQLPETLGGKLTLVPIQEC